MIHLRPRTTVIEILTEIAKHTAQKGYGPRVADLEIEHEDEVDLIDRLVSKNYIRKNGDRFNVSIDHVLYLEDEGLRVLRELLARVYAYLRNHYVEKQSDRVDMMDLRKRANLSEARINECLIYLYETKIFGYVPKDPWITDVTVNKQVLGKKTLDELLAAHRAMWVKRLSIVNRQESFLFLVEEILSAEKPSLRITKAVAKNDSTYDITVDVDGKQIMVNISENLIVEINNFKNGEDASVWIDYKKSLLDLLNSALKYKESEGGMAMTDHKEEIKKLINEGMRIPPQDAGTFIQQLVGDNYSLKSHPFSIWRSRALSILGAVMGEKRFHFKDFSNRCKDPLNKDRDVGLGILNAVLDDLQQGRLEIRKEKQTSVVQGPVEIIRNVARRFDRAVSVLKDRKRDKPPFKVNDEYDLQDLFHALLRIQFDDIRTEVRTAKYSGSEKQMDFVIRNERIVVETKMASSVLREKVLGEQLNEDVTWYRKNKENCKTLVCFVYDPDRVLKNPAELMEIETRSDPEFTVIVVIAPQVD